MQKFKIKPLSTNDAWKGRQFSTEMKTVYEFKLRQLLRDIILENCDPPYFIHFRFHVPVLQDYDNCIKCTQDVLCTHFGINDRDIHKALIEKIPTKKGLEYFEVQIESLNSSPL